MAASLVGSGRLQLLATAQGGETTEGGEQQPASGRQRHGCHRVRRREIDDAVALAAAEIGQTFVEGLVRQTKPQRTPVSKGQFERVIPGHASFLKHA